MPFWLFISINWIVHRIGWNEPSEALKVTLSGNLPEVQTSSSASQEIATSHQKLLCNSASIISECLPSALQLAKGRGTKHRKAQAPTEAGCIWLGFREQCCQGSASYLRMAGCLSEQGKQQGQKEIAKANAKDGTEKA